MNFLGPQLLSILFCFIFFFCLYQYWELIKSISNINKLFLLFLRTSILIILLLLLANPWIEYDKYIHTNQNIDIIFDHSKSMEYHYSNQKIDISNILNNIELWGENNNLELDLYMLNNGTISELNNINSYGSYTDFTEIEKYILYEKPDQVILVSDGIATKGKELIDLTIPANNIIHSIGMGSTKKHIDIKIERVDFPLSILDTDTINIFIKIRSYLNDYINSKIKILNSRNEIIYTGTLKFETGDNIKELQITLPANEFIGLSKIIIDPILNEIDVDNNQYLFNINLKPSNQRILLLSGSLSLNTRFINQTLEQMDNFVIDHYFRINHNIWNKPKKSILYDNTIMIILDDFPIYERDKEMLSRIHEKALINKIPIIYIEGPQSNLTSAELIRNIYSSLIPKPISQDLLTNLSYANENSTPFIFDISNFPPQARTIQWISDSNIWKKYSDGSILLYNSNNFTLLSMPDMSSSINKTKSMKETSFNNFIKNMFIYTSNKNQGLMTLNVIKNIYSIGEIVAPNLFIIDEIGISDIELFLIHDKYDTNKYEFDLDIITNNYISKINLDKTGKYELVAQGKMVDGSIVSSNKNTIVVQDIDVEYKKLIQDQNQLQRVSNSTGGEYAQIKLLDSLLNNINISPLKIEKKYQISGLSTQYYWWIIIILLCIEWYFRKKLGYL